MKSEDIRRVLKKYIEAEHPNLGSGKSEESGKGVLPVVTENEMQSIIDKYISRGKKQLDDSRIKIEQRDSGDKQAKEVKIRIQKSKIEQTLQDEAKNVLISMSIPESIVSEKIKRIKLN